jgi:hypothetical protein
VVLIQLINIKNSLFKFNNLKVFQLFVGLFLFFISACGNYEAQLNQQKTIDSLQTTLIVNKNHLLQIDSAELLKAISKYEVYQQFIKSNVKDTLSKEEAYALQSFIIAGENLKAVSENKKRLMARTNLLSNQLNKLQIDIKNNINNAAETNNYLNAEKATQAELTNFCENEQSNYFKNLQQLKTNLYLIEQLILARNNNQLPNISNINPH